MNDVSEYKKRVDHMIDEIKSARKAAGAKQIYFPGEIESDKMAKCLETGFVEVDDSTLQKIEAIEKEYGLI